MSLGWEWQFLSIFTAFSFTKSCRWSSGGPLHRGSLAGVGFLPCKASWIRDTGMRETAYPKGHRKLCGCYFTAQDPRHQLLADLCWTWPSSQQPLANLTGAASHFSWPKLCILFCFWMPMCNSQSFWPAHVLCSLGLLFSVWHQFYHHPPHVSDLPFKI